MVANEKFENAVFSDECTVQLDHHGRVCFRRKKEPRKLKPWAKHPVKFHIWGAISQCCTTGHLHGCDDSHSLL